MSSPTGPAPELAPVVADEFIRYFRHLAGRVDRHVHSIPREKIWIRPFPFGNSIGHLILHLTGNLNHYIGSLIAGTGYERHREYEFTDPTRYSRGELLIGFQQAVDMVVRTLEAQDGASFAIAVPDQPPI